MLRYLDRTDSHCAYRAFLAAMYNGLVRLRNVVDEAWNQISVQLKRRHDLIPNLVNAVKGYMDFEQETLTKVIEARGAAVSGAQAGPAGVAHSAQAENFPTGALGVSSSRWWRTIPT